MQAITDSFNALSNDLQKHPIVALLLWIGHFTGAVYFSYVNQVDSWHIPSIITEVLQNLCYFGGICVSYLTLYPVIKKQFKSFTRKNG